MKEDGWMVTQIKRRVLIKNFNRFCRVHNVDPQELLGLCEGRLSNFPYWYVDYINYVRKSMQDRIRTGEVHKLSIYEVWS